MMPRLALLLLCLLTETAFAERICWPKDFPDPTLWTGKDGKFYAYATTGGGNGLSYLVSDDALTWKSSGRRPFSKDTFAQIKAGWGNVWAPDRAVVAGKPLLYVSLYNSAADSAIGVFRLDEQGAATDLHVLTRSKETGIRDTIDPEVVTDPKTRRVWLFFGSIDGIHRVELTADGLAVKRSAKYVHVAGCKDVGRGRARVFEGAYLHYRQGWWYLFVSAGFYMNKSYNLRVGRSRTLEGVFRDREGREMKDGFATPVLGSEGDFYGPGHNGDILIGKDGVARIYYHCHWKGADREGRSPRILLARQLTWDDQGWPITVKEKED